MRALLLIGVYLVFSFFVNAQTTSNLEGTYKRYWPVIGGGQIEDVLKLTGKMSGDFEVNSTGGQNPEFATGRWFATKITAWNKERLNIVILLANESIDSLFFSIEKNGRLRRISNDGHPLMKGALYEYYEKVTTIK
jgi:hypothetical protein